MEFIEQIKNRIGFYQLRRYVDSHPTGRTYKTLSDAEEIGILYHATQLDEEQIVHQYAGELRKQGKKVFLMGYVDMKTLPGNKKFSLQSEFIWKEKLNAFNLPDRGKVGRFLDTPFDLLLCIAQDPLLPILALSAYASAAYRVGPAVPDGTRYFDAMIDTGANKDLRFLIAQIDFYLRTIR